MTNTITFNEIHENYDREIVSLIKNNIKNDAIFIEDVINDVYAHINTILPKFDNSKCNSPINYLNTVVKYKTMDIDRESNREVHKFNRSFVSLDDVNFDDYNYDPYDSFEVQDENDIQESLIKDILNDGETEIYNLFYTDGKSYEEIADELLININNVKIKLHRLRNKISQLFGIVD